MNLEIVRRDGRFQGFFRLSSFGRRVYTLYEAATISSICSCLFSCFPGVLSRSLFSSDSSISDGINFLLPLVDVGIKPIDIMTIIYL